MIVRLSNFAGVPSVPDNDLQGASPRGMAIRFYLGEHVHTDIVAHSFDGFPTHTGEEFLEFVRALAASGPAAPSRRRWKNSWRLIRPSCDSRLLPSRSQPVLLANRSLASQPSNSPIETERAALAAIASGLTRARNI